jgi:hypothetical protein
MRIPQPRLEPPRRDRTAIRRGPLVIALLLVAALAMPAIAGDPPPFNARGGLDLAREAALGWSADAFLIYIENDEALDAKGAATRWGYLFYSPALGKARVYSVRDGKILLAEFLDVKLEAPAVAKDWIDSGAALEAAEQAAGRAFRREHDGRLSTMLLMRGAFEDERPDQTTWTLVYTAPHAPSLFVVVDASEGKVRRTWRG